MINLLMAEWKYMINKLKIFYRKFMMRRRMQFVFDEYYFILLSKF